LNKIIFIIVLLSQLLSASMDIISKQAEHNTLRVIVPLEGNKVSTGTGFLVNKYVD